MKTIHNLPIDLQRFAKRKLLERVVPCVILLATFATVLFFWGDIVLPIKETHNKIIVYILVMLLPFAFTGVPFKLKDKTFYGTVEKIELDTRWHKNRYERGYTTNTYVLTVRTTDGETVVQRGHTTGVKLEHTENIYKIGDGVFHLYGSKYVVVFPESTEISLICPCCGGFNYSADRDCRDCGHTLIKDFPYSPKNKIDY